MFKYHKGKKSLYGIVEKSQHNSVWKETQEVSSVTQNRVRCGVSLCCLGIYSLQRETAHTFQATCFTICLTWAKMFFLTHSLKLPCFSLSKLFLVFTAPSTENWDSTILWSSGTGGCVGCLEMVSPPGWKIPRSLTEELLPDRQDIAPHFVIFVCWQKWGFLSAHSSSISRSFWMTALFLSVLVTYLHSHTV